ncbi:DNA-binding protein [Propionibacterium freudenreichii]|uniref:helix-turn-helix domain-containing protein n=1 Tax=Propionibacterium freudenreichii TaxID=1744 RepID=UPI0021A656C6|nr:helix-turn-helix domain-containing protein [Propionibacterium freudenreichii]MCT2995277.1 DNA-binding protein [Propionibacterium freudenreichii]
MGTAYSPASSRTHYLTLQEAVAEGYGAYSTLRSWIAQGKLPASKTGSRVKILRSDLDALARPAGVDPIEAAIERLVAAAPPLTPEQTSRLRDLLGEAS